MLKVHQFLIQLRLHLKGKLDKVLLLIISIILLLGVAYISDYAYYKYNIEPWELSLNLYRFSFLLLLISLRNEVEKIIKPLGYRIITYLLVNHFIDRYFGLIGWSWNDFLTIILVLVDVINIKYKYKTKTQN